MTCRTEEGVAYIQTYNTENRISSIIKLASPSGTCAAPGPFAAKWDFAYDGDGVRVSTLLTPYDETGTPLTPEMTSYFFGGAYETRSDGTNIKYYSFAGQTIAMDDGTGLQYFLTDHLGSVVATTDSTGTLISQQRYLPFGGVRPNVPTPSGPATDLGYTGQRNLDAGIGLMDYKARFYSAYLNRFVQPDSLIPSLYDPQSLNRFSYVGNNPIKYTDPSGHCRMDAKADDCFRPGFNNPPSFAEQLKQYGITVDPKMDKREIKDILSAVISVGDKFAEKRGLGESSSEAFTAVYDPITFEQRDNYGGCETTLTYKISCGDFTYNHPQSSVNNIVHELGHVLNNLVGGGPYNLGWAYADPEDSRQKILRPGPDANGVVWQQNTFYNPDYTVKSGGEMFGDMFVAWVFDAWNTNPDNAGIVKNARTTMNANMAEWIK